jgi:hypothetical protein
VSHHRGILQQHLTQCLERTEERISWLLALEDRPFTMNAHFLKDYRNKFLSHYKGARELYEQPDLMRIIQSSSFSQTMALRATNAYAAQSTGIAIREGSGRFSRNRDERYPTRGLAEIIIAGQDGTCIGDHGRCKSLLSRQVSFRILLSLSD